MNINSVDTLPHIQSPQRDVSTIVLGTVQFGLPYGIANKSGQPDIGKVKNILDYANENGIRTLDTAAAYGDSEKVLGQCGMDHWSVITKIPSLHEIDDANVGAKATEIVSRSLDLLNIDTLYGLMAHDYHDMVGDRGRRIRDALAPFLENGRIGKIGVSIYEPCNLANIDIHNTQLVQAPANVFDQRLVSSNEGKRLKSTGSEIHARSVFLQGLLLMSEAIKPAYFTTWSREFAQFYQQVKNCKISKAAFCLGYVSRQENIDRCLVGVDTVEQLSEIIEAFHAGQEAKIIADDLRSDDVGLIDPRQWRVS